MKLQLSLLTLTTASAATLRSAPTANDANVERDLQTTLYYPKFTGDWATGYCSTHNYGSGQSYTSELACCKGSFAGQTSGFCFSKLASPPTSSPTGSDGLDVWYPDYDQDWTDATCINEGPIPNGRPTYDTMLACCKAAYSGQSSGACLQALPTPPTSSPTGADGLDVWYADYDQDWADATCINEGPVPNGRPVYDTMLACCKAAYSGQSSGACLQALPTPPTSSPTGADGLDVWYADYDQDWTNGVCINEGPVPNGRPVYDSMLACCKGAYSGQLSGACIQALPTPPTSSPTSLSNLPFFPVWSGWESGHCDNDPSKMTTGNAYTFDTQAECCDKFFPNQATGACMAFDPTYGTKSPTGAPIQ